MQSTFTQELPGENLSHMRLLPTSTKKGVPPSLASTAVTLGEKGGSRGGTSLGEKHIGWKGGESRGWRAVEYRQDRARNGPVARE
jgi:hypothetical protein